ncbi:D-2-hydroxyacid dehydrogenase like protein [Verticillium longisporum]|uniref:2-hydroxyacid dehydrogenase n=3 Tax=Verticillium TaxID=1036719 RepID=G2XC36_VERDV|nr:2-hydroxyacid dehydrogenase [Verticillium dahliae VdLs.17]KAF3349412.1 putative membrane protein [Verticillium dahliae VDG2]KAF3361038.1 hypothetical protein VdG1_01047 [Verticillium dahliae VDG1]KAG7135088.1 D-2-hydroxyacid dehydrogenase like protein [Verticillium longisporum]KAH6699155.1 2-hydroxyacid dehydrogenase [Verticillium dahliae]EGY16554.1 2-hydroxyacid dehydrogenase [Verticillium dahliae VdLs.17]
MSVPSIERVLFALPVPEPKEALARLKQKFPQIETTWITTAGPDKAGWGPGELDKSIFADKTALITLSALPPTAADAPNLKFIHFAGSGTNHIAGHPILTDSTIPLTNSRGIAGPPIAEWVVMTALVHNHKYNYLNELQRESTWGSIKDFWSVRDVVGQRIGILGYGAIGRQVGRIAKALGMDVVAFTATPKDTPEKRKDRGYIVPGTGDPDGEYPSAWYHGLDRPSLHDFLKQDLDIIVIALPLTDQTRHLFSAEEFEILASRKAFVSNISRGAILDQDALVAALESGKLRGAALDVTDPEPLPADHPLWKAPNVIITPHISSIVGNYTERVLGVVELNLERLLSGGELVNLVDRERGY